MASRRRGQRASLTAWIANGAAATGRRGRALPVDVTPVPGPLRRPARHRRARPGSGFAAALGDAADPPLEVDFIPRIGAALGNVAIYGDIGGTVRIGKNLRDDFGPPRLRLALPGPGAVTWNGVRLTCTQVLRSPDFYQQRRWTRFDSFNVTFRF